MTVTYLVKIEYHNWMQDLALRNSKNEAFEFIDSVLHKENIEHTIVYELNTKTLEIAEYLDYGLEPNS